jgi:uncharacterized membrane protein
LASNSQRMTKPLKSPRKELPWIVRFLRGHWRLWSCAAAGFVVFALLPAQGLPVPRFFFAWDAGVIFYVCAIYRMIYGAAADHIRQHAAEGQELVLSLAIAAVIVSLSLVVVWLSTTPVALTVSIVGDAASNNS